LKVLQRFPYHVDKKSSPPADNYYQKRQKISINIEFGRMQEGLIRFLRVSRQDFDDVFLFFEFRPLMQSWAKLVLIALKRYSVALKRLTFNLR
jgi:hypothetical protein